jgi:hypothetical protein
METIFELKTFGFDIMLNYYLYQSMNFFLIGKKHELIGKINLII